jgi:hypothetical protein
MTHTHDKAVHSGQHDLLRVDDLSLEGEFVEAGVQTDFPESDMGSVDQLLSLLGTSSPVDYVHRLRHRFSTLLRKGHITGEHVASLQGRLRSYTLHDAHPKVSLVQMIRDTGEKVPATAQGRVTRGGAHSPYRAFLDELLRDIPTLPHSVHPFLKKVIYQINHDLLR